jgi:hypothetical protein
VLVSDVPDTDVPDTDVPVTDVPVTPPGAPAGVEFDLQWAAAEALAPAGWLLTSRVMRPGCSVAELP